MSFDKAILHKKEKREQYRGMKLFDPWCRNHGNDDWAKNNRLFQYNKVDLYSKREVNFFSKLSLKNILKFFKF